MNRDLSYFARDLQELASDPDLIRWLTVLPEQLEKFMLENEHGDFGRWFKHLDKIARYRSSHRNFSSYVEIGRDDEISEGQKKDLANSLMQYAPWRKGPYRLFGIDLESEWRSDKKWDRLINNIAPLKGRRILDIGCGNGYHLWRMLNEGAAQVCGIDPCTNYFFQFAAIRTMIENISGIHFFPLALQDLPDSRMFDTVFSMGVIYHQKSPIEHLEKIRKLLVPGGQMVLETLFVTGDSSTVLTPEDRYARMGNIWFIPSIDALSLWLRKTGFRDIKVHNTAVTDSSEQHATGWSCTESLDDFLDPENPKLTVEGYEAPQRVIITAVSP